MERNVLLMIQQEDREAHLLYILRRLNSSWNYYIERDTGDVVLYNSSGLEIHAPVLLSALNAALSLYGGNN